MLSDVDLTRDRILGQEPTSAKDNFIQILEGPSRHRLSIGRKHASVLFYDLIGEELPKEQDHFRTDEKFGDWWQGGTYKDILKRRVDPFHEQKDDSCYRCGTTLLLWEKHSELCPECERTMSIQPRSSDETIEGILGLR